MRFDTRAGAADRTTPWQVPVGLMGLTTGAAAERLRAEGANELPVVRARGAWRQIAAQLSHFFAILLWVAGTLAIVAGMPELGVAIFLVVVVNGLFAYAQEHRAERAAHRLQSLLPRRAVVLRDDAWVEIDARGLVTTDLVALAAGDRICADVRLLHGRGLLIDQSTLTGESVPVGAEPGDEAFAGTFVVEGEAKCVVVNTGGRTRFARIAELTQRGSRPRTPLALELDRVVRIVATIAVLIGVAFFGVGVLVGLPPRSGFLLAIGVAVALVPEGLLPTMTLSLAVGASRMARRGALVRRLEAVETLGSTTFVCSDKTGTLTSNQMNVVEAWTPSGGLRVRGQGYEPNAELEMSEAVSAPARRLALISTRCSSGRALRRDGHWVARGDPMEAALHTLSLRLGVDVAADERARPEIARFAFDPHRRRMSVVVPGAVYVKGAPDSVLPCCPAAEAAVERAADMAARGLRVMAVAQRQLAAGAIPDRAGEAEEELELVGLVGLVDPPRPEARGALEACQRAGMRVAVVTGDHPGTARAIAAEVGLSTDLVVTGDELPPDEATLGQLLDRDGVVVCRVSPEQKLRIARALQARGHVVAMTGDGVNDGPALRQADVGIAMGRSGTDVAREAADLVLLDDRFETIVEAIEQGRSTFANMRRSLTYHLTDNVAELAPFAIWALSGGHFPLALGVLQMLCLDLLTDQFPALALGAEPPNQGILVGAIPSRRLIDVGLIVRAFGVLGPTEALVEIVAFVAALMASGWHVGGPAPTTPALLVASGTAFVSIVIGQSATAFACRSATLPAWRVPLRSNPPLLLALSASIGIVAVLCCVPPLAHLLGHAPPTPRTLAVALLAFPLVIMADALYKHRLSGWSREPHGRSPRIFHRVRGETSPKE